MSSFEEHQENVSLKIHPYVSRANMMILIVLIDRSICLETIQSRITSKFKNLRQANLVFLNAFNKRYTLCQIKSKEIHYIYISLSVAKCSTSKINISSDI